MIAVLYSEFGQKANTSGAEVRTPPDIACDTEQGNHNAEIQDRL
jgi:PHD/YefM family antitoxin component YafN of YafNO toxin-antitoxin module